MNELKIGTLVKVIQEGTNREGDYGRVLNHEGTRDYPNDYWIEFESGHKAPYGDYELEVVTMETLDKEEKRIRQRRDYLLVGNWSPVKD